MRPSVAIVFLLAVCYGCVTHGDATESSRSATVQPATPSPESLRACVWIWDRDGSTQFRYTVDLDKEKAGVETSYRTPANQTPDCAKLRAERKKRDAETYTRIVERFNHQRGQSNLDKNLVETVQWIEESTKWGASRANWIIASPDGAYAVFSAHGKPLLLIDVATLGTRVLAKTDPYLNHATPVAWAPDSLHFAYAPLNSGHLYIFSAERREVVSTIIGTSWVEDLSWSPDMQRIAVFELINRRLNKTPLGLLAAAAGHPEFRNDWALNVYRMSGERRHSVILKRGMSEWGSANIEIEWK